MREGLATIGARPGRLSHDLWPNTVAVTRLARLGFLSDIEVAALREVPVATESFAPREHIIRQGSSPDSLYFLISGWTYQYITTRHGGRQISALVLPGGVCNLANLALERADFGVCAVTQATAVVLPRSRALALASQYPGIGQAFTWLAISENAILSQWAVRLGLRSAMKRVAHFLCEISVRTGSGKAGDKFDLPLTQELIADAVGLTPIHVNRTLQQLRLEGLITSIGRTITIPDFDRLRAACGFDASYLRHLESGASLPRSN